MHEAEKHKLIRGTVLAQRVAHLKGLLISRPKLPYSNKD